MFCGFLLNRECFPQIMALSIGNASLQACYHKSSREWQFCTLSTKVFPLSSFVIWGIKTHSRVSGAKEDVRDTSVLFTGTAKSPFLTPHISITTGPISIKFTYCMPSIYTTLHAKFEENRLSSLRYMLLKIAQFSSSHRFNTTHLNQKNILLIYRFPSHILAYLRLKFGDV